MIKKLLLNMAIICLKAINKNIDETLSILLGNEVEAQMFGEGKALECIMISPDEDGGYIFEAYDKSLCEDCGDI